MSCPYSFYRQCSKWILFVALAVPTGLVIAATVLILGLHDYQTVSKIIIFMGTVTCFVWWLWIMKKLHDMANWWIDLIEKINLAATMLYETRQDLKEIKQTL